ncbi:hypothetical protein IMSAG025_02336 [Muribaculaceae bacterium]|nr:hypothetical protein IMSAG025_02336 [Muribaculaceae bacterium]
MHAVRLVENHIQNDSYSFSVTFVDKLFIILWRSVCLVNGKIEVRVISPGYVAVEFVYREEFDSVHTE